MPIRFGTVLAVSPDGSSLIRLDDGQELRFSHEQMTAFGVSHARSAARIRASLSPTGKVEKLVVISAEEPANAGEERSVAARVTRVDRSARMLYLDTDQGSRKFGPVQLSDKQWARLQANPTVTIRIASDGKAQLILSPAVDDGAANDERTQTAPIRVLRSTGTITQVGPYYASIEGIDQQHYGIMCARFPGTVLHQGDQVAFTAIADTLEIIDITILERQAEGVGARNPCGDALEDLVARTGRQAIAELARHFCSDNRIDWYWITPQKLSSTVPLHGTLDDSVAEAIRFADRGFSSFYRHQAKAFEALRAGKHVLVTTPTASGKTNCYNPAIFQVLQRDPSARALYVFPLNALLEDQVAKLRSIVKGFEQYGANISVDQLIGGLEKTQRDDISNDVPQIIATNPEMLCWVLDGNAYGGWPEFFGRLRFVVLDEAHAYRGLLGLHMAGIVRRVLIACRRHGNPSPQFVLSSATVGDPEQLASRLTSLSLNQFVLIGDNEDGSLQQQRHWMVLSPFGDGDDNLHNMHLHQAALALVDVLTVPSEDLNAILFAKSIRDVNFIKSAVDRLLADRGRSDLVGKVTKFAGAMLSITEKRRIYEGLRDKGPRGLRAVVSTNALEAGIDIGKLDVCIISGFPFHVMRMRQMAGRAGRKDEGAVIYIPHPVHVIDKYYADQPQRLLTQPPESFVIDHENPYIARKHIAASAATMSGGVLRSELDLFGGRLDQILDDGVREHKLQPAGNSMFTARKPHKGSPWAVGNLRSSEQNPYTICTAAPGQRSPCGNHECLERAQETNGNEQHCAPLVQLLDRQYVYRDAHPGAVFEDREGRFFEVVDLDDEQKAVWAKPLPDNTTRRTFADESVHVYIKQEKGQRELANGAVLAWGEVVVTRRYSGFFEYSVIPKRRCPSCRTSYHPDVTHCSQCNSKTRPYLSTTRPGYRDFPGKYVEQVYSLRLETIACWLKLPSSFDQALEAVSRCKIPGPSNRVSVFLHTEPPFANTQDVAKVVGLSDPEAEATYTYFADSSKKISKQRSPKRDVAVYPAFYGQCLRYHLRQNLPEDQAIGSFGQVTGYPVLTDERHICRNCAGSTLIPAAHTLEHAVALRYPTFALGDSQDLGFTTAVLHPQTRSTTTFWYDNYDGGIGAAEKIFEMFDAFLHQVLSALNCECRSDDGCPMCTQTLQCDRHNQSLSKEAARGLIHHLLGLPAYIPVEPIYWTASESKEKDQESEAGQRAQEHVPTPDKASAPSADPYQLLRLQHHVHDQVLETTMNIRGEEIASESPPISIAQLQSAYQTVFQMARPKNWDFPDGWNAYEVLHILPDASKRHAQSAYKTIVRNVHPDHNISRKEWANEVTKRVNTAWTQVKSDWANDKPDE